MISASHEVFNLGNPRKNRDEKPGRKTGDRWAVHQSNHRKTAFHRARPPYPPFENREGRGTLSRDDSPKESKRGHPPSRSGCYGRVSVVPPGLVEYFFAHPALKRWATFGRPSGTLVSVPFQVQEARVGVNDPASIAPIHCGSLSANSTLRDSIRSGSWLSSWA